MCFFVFFVFVFIFFFQAEDGIRDIGVTGVQTCALPIYINQCQNYFRNKSNTIYSKSYTDFSNTIQFLS